MIRDSGAYGFTMASHYNGRPLPAEVFVSRRVASSRVSAPVDAELDAWICSDHASGVRAIRFEPQLAGCAARSPKQLFGSRGRASRGAWSTTVWTTAAESCARAHDLAVAGDLDAERAAAPREPLEIDRGLHEQATRRARIDEKIGRLAAGAQHLADVRVLDPEKAARLATNVPRPTTTLACAMRRDSVSGIGATASMRALTMSASTPAERARARLGGVRITSIRLGDFADLDERQQPEHRRDAGLRTEPQHVVVDEMAGDWLGGGMLAAESARPRGVRRKRGTELGRPVLRLRGSRC